MSTNKLITFDPKTPLPIALESLGLLKGPLGKAYYEAVNIVGQSSIPVLTTNDVGLLELVGSGFVMSFRTRFFLFSAAHVFDIGRKKSLYIPDQEYIGPGTELEGVFFVTFASSDGREYDTDDIGFIEISEDKVAGLQKSGRYIIPYESLVVENPIYTSNIVAGFPSSQSKSNFGTKSIGFKQLTLSGIYGKPEKLLDDGFKHENNLFLPRSKHVVLTETGIRKTPPDLHGLSGGPVWSLPNIEEWIRGNNIPVLSGLIISQHKQQRIMVGTRISRALLFLKLFEPSFELERAAIIKHMKASGIKEKLVMGRWSVADSKITASTGLIQNII